MPFMFHERSLCLYYHVDKQQMDLCFYLSSGLQVNLYHCRLDIFYLKLKVAKNKLIIFFTQYVVLLSNPHWRMAHSSNHKSGTLESILFLFIPFNHLLIPLIIKLEQVCPLLSTRIPLFQSYINSFIYCHSHIVSSLWSPMNPLPRQYTCSSLSQELPSIPHFSLQYSVVRQGLGIQAWVKLCLQQTTIWIC